MSAGRVSTDRHMSLLISEKLWKSFVEHYVPNPNRSIVQSRYRILREHKDYFVK